MVIKMGFQKSMGYKMRWDISKGHSTDRISNSFEVVGNIEWYFVEH